MLTRIVSFDGTERVLADLARPDRYRHLFDAMAGDAPCIPRGAGLSYCSASAGDGVRSISSKMFNRILSFDGEKGIVDVEPGVTLGDLYRFTSERGWILPVMPGHPSITVGGCVGCNVHGKNHFLEGNFIRVVDGLRLFHPAYGEMDCDMARDTLPFRLTVGGYGLTGFMTSVRLRLQRLGGSNVRMQRIHVANLSETVKVLNSKKETSQFLYSWNDFNLRGPSFGRGFVYSGVIEQGLKSRKLEFRNLEPERRGWLPFGCYSRATTRFMLGAYHWFQSLGDQETLMPHAEASFPPNGKEYYFSLFGEKGFREYQMLIPFARWDEAEAKIPHLIEQFGAPVTLGSVKIFNGECEYLHFNGEGLAVSVDVPEGNNARGLFEAFDSMVLSLGGVANLSKDSRVRGELARKIFHGYDQFKDDLNRFDPGKKFDSSLRRRLGV